jgi:hypothetical protein
MNIIEAKKIYRDACYNGILKDIKVMIKTYGISELDHFPDDSESLSWAFRRKHFDIVDYLLFSNDTKQYFKVPYSLMYDLSRFNHEVIEYLCNNEKIQSILNIFDSSYYLRILKSACEHGLVDTIEKLVLSEKSKEFWREKIIALNEIASSKNPNVKNFDTIYSQVLNDEKSDKKLFENNLLASLFSALGEDNLDIASYLILDKNLQIQKQDREIIKKSFPNGEKLFLTRELNQTLTKDISSETNKIRKSNKL